MTATASIRFPRPHRVMTALLWELIWKNKVVFPALAVLLAFGIGLAFVPDYSLPDDWWAKYAKGSGLVAFLASMLLGFAPFSLMDNHGGWRMNSVTSRWSILPVGTLALVGVPLLGATALITLLIAAWTPVLDRLFPGIDMPYVLVVFVAGAALLQALAWAIPRRPGQYWVLAALLFLVLLLGSLLPQESPDWAFRRGRVFTGLTLAAMACASLALWAARRNRCGDWPGEIPLTRALDRLRRPGGGSRIYRRPIPALLWSEAVPVWRTFLISLAVLMALVAAWGGIMAWMRRPGLPVDWVMLGQAMLVEAGANVGALWLMVWGLFLGCEPGLGFQTRLSGFRATCPVTVGTLAGMRMAAVGMVWLSVWAPLLLLQHAFIMDDPGMPQGFANFLSQQASDLTARRMLFSASAVVGALPLLLWGRLEGFPTVFLATLIAWAWTWILTGFALQTPPSEWLLWILGGLLSVKLAASCAALFRSQRRGYVTGRFAVALFGVWVCAVGGMLCLFPIWQAAGLQGALAVAVLVPITRLAACPLAMAANRHS